MSSISEENIQRHYYATTASRYDEMRAGERDVHGLAFAYVSAFLHQLAAGTVLEVGCGTGRAIAHLTTSNPNVAFYGIEPVSQLLEVAVDKGIDRKRLLQGSGSDLPFSDGSFDIVLECETLHHIREPQRVVREMMRVSRKAVVLCDSNVFGQGRVHARFLKLALYRAGLWKVAKLIQTAGKGYTLSEGDGLAYSYSVYFSYRQLQQWADHIIAVPLRQTGPPPMSWSPVLTADTVLLCAMRR